MEKRRLRMGLGIAAAAAVLLGGAGAVYASNSSGGSDGPCGPVPSLEAAVAAPDSAGGQVDVPADAPLCVQPVAPVPPVNF